MERIILGDGISAYIIATCLETRGIYFTIYGNGKYKAPNILLLEYDNNYLKNRYFNIFNIYDDDIEKYIKHVKIGYMKDYDEIINSPDETMLSNYYRKQTRVASAASMSNGKTSFDAIDLKKIYYKLKDKYSKYFIEKEITTDFVEELKSQKHTIIYNTIIPTDKNNNECSIEYIRPTNNWIINEFLSSEYDYIYDCRLNTRIKRYTKETVEYRMKPAESVKPLIEIKNYYFPPKIYKESNMKNNSFWYDISRNATKTQLKQEDIIKYVLELENNV